MIVYASAEPAPYDVLAQEYYNPSHQTSRNFDATAARALEAIRAKLPTDGLVLEVGAGRGRTTEFLGIDSNRIVQLDNSSQMLSVEPREPCLLRVLHRAEVLPFLSDSFSSVTAFLCDPFLGLDFLAEAYRVLTPGGLLVATTPSYEWGVPLRKGLRLTLTMTRFITRTGTVVVPSVLVPVDQLRGMTQVAGFTDVNVTITSHSLPVGTSPISPDILSPAEKLGRKVEELEILYCLAARK